MKRSISPCISDIFLSFRWGAIISFVIILPRATGVPAHWSELQQLARLCPKTPFQSGLNRLLWQPALLKNSRAEMRLVCQWEQPSQWQLCKLSVKSLDSLSHFEAVSYISKNQLLYDGKLQRLPMPGNSQALMHCGISANRRKCGLFGFRRPGVNSTLLLTGCVTLSQSSPISDPPCPLL